MREKRHVFIIGSKGIPARYGGFETFVDELVKRRVSDEICYHVACAVDDKKILKKNRTRLYKGAECFSIYRAPIGAGKAVLYDLSALKYCIRYIRKHKISRPVIYILACRIGPFLFPYSREIKKLGGKLLINPDGHEWERAKWNQLIKEYWKISERKMISAADLVICDSKNIQAYVQKKYHLPSTKTTFIPYGADIVCQSRQQDTALPDKLKAWYQKWNLCEDEYYLIVGRFVPENNYETMLQEFRHSDTRRKLVIISNIKDDARFYQELSNATHFAEDERIIFAGTVYDKELLLHIRQHAFAYLHGHSVGGTNPSLLEAMGTTDINLLYDVSFNREVGKQAAFYWTKEKGSLSQLICQVEQLSKEQRQKLGESSRKTIAEHYSWDQVIDSYEKVFLRIFKKGKA